MQSGESGPLRGVEFVSMACLHPIPGEYSSNYLHLYHAACLFDDHLARNQQSSTA